MLRERVAGIQPSTVRWHSKNGGIAYDCAVRALQSQKGTQQFGPTPVAHYNLPTP
jgi:hypothetical protein